MRRSLIAVALTLCVGQPAGAQAPIAAPADRPPQVWAVLVGVQKYDDPAIPACAGAVADEVALAGWLQKSARWDSANILRMDEFGQPTHGLPSLPVGNLRPTRENLDFALKGWLRYRVRPGDVVVFAFAGHGAVAPADPGAKAEAPREILLPIDARKSDLARTGWSPEDGLDELATLSPRAVLCLMDTSLHGRGQTVAPPDDPKATLRFLRRLARWPGVSAWMAADGRPSAGPGPGPNSHGPLTAALLRGLGDSPNNVRAALNVIFSDETLKAQGFRPIGGVAPEVTLWPSQLKRPELFVPRLLLQQGHAAAITGMVATPDGEELITSSEDSTVRLWRLSDRKLLRVFGDHLVGVKAVGMTTDGHLMASGDGKGRINVRDLTRPIEMGMKSVPRQPHSVAIEAIEFLPEGRAFVTLDAKGNTVAWDASAAEIATRPLMEVACRRLATATLPGPVALVVVGSDGQVRLFGKDLAAVGVLDGPPERVTALALSPDGTRAAAGDDSGQLWIYDLKTKTVTAKPKFEETVGLLKFSEDGRLLVASGDGLTVFDPDRNGARTALEFDGPAASASFSRDGRWLAALSKIGTLHLWSFGADGRPSRTVLAGAEGAGSFRSVAIAADSRTVLAGEASGGFRQWELPDGGLRSRVASHRGRVRSLAVAKGEDGQGRYLLQITHDGIAQLWDLQEIKDGQTVRTLQGLWTSAAFLPGDASKLLMTRDADSGGTVVMVEADSGKVVREYPRPPSADGGVSEIDFDRVTVSPDGARVAAAAADGRRPIVCVWKIEGGPPAVLARHTGSPTVVAFSSDAKSLLTAGKDGLTMLWDMAKAPEVAPVILAASVPGEVITAAALAPAGPTRIVTCRYSADDYKTRIETWDLPPNGGKPTPMPVPGGLIEGMVPALAFTADGRWLAASGQNRTMNVWETTNGGRKLAVRPNQFHDEQVNALVGWPKGAMFASGSDDTTVRLWAPEAARPEDQQKVVRWTLLGSMSAAPPEFDGPPKARTSPEWVLFTPDGKFDSSLQGEHLVTFVQDQEVRPLDQYLESHYQSGLGDSLRQGKAVPAVLTTPKSSVAIDPPPTVSPDRETRLTISITDAALKQRDLRLYHNDQPVQTVEDFTPVPGTDRRFVATVKLRGGTNRFYAMAGSREGVDTRSKDVQVEFDAPEDRGRIHVLALGISEYAKNALKFAHADAQSIAETLGDRAVAAGRLPGLLIVLKNTEVGETRLDAEFRRLRAEIQGHPEDTIVVFLAGHTGVVKKQPDNLRFSLLMPDFPFPDETLKVASVRGPAEGVLPADKDSTYIPYYILSRNLARIDALQRLVIVDACQAEAILSDQGVLQVQRFMEKGARKAKTSYLLAARRGEPAYEDADLRHGLLTYTLLRGLQAPKLEPLPRAVPDLDRLPSADLDGDGTITTQELRDYTDQTLPLLAQNYPRGDTRGEGSVPRGTGPISARSRKLWLRSADVSFPLLSGGSKPKPAE